MTIRVQNAAYAGQAFSGANGARYLVDADGFVDIDEADTDTAASLGFISVAYSQGISGLTPLLVTSPSTVTLEEAVAKINEIIAALQS